MVVAAVKATSSAETLVAPQHSALPRHERQSQRFGAAAPVRLSWREIAADSTNSYSTQRMSLRSCFLNFSR
jgi:hypothetical protein